MESALYGIYALVVFVSEILLVRFLIRQQLVRKYRTPALSMKYSLFTRVANYVSFWLLVELVWQSETLKMHAFFVFSSVFLNWSAMVPGVPSGDRGNWGYESWRLLLCANESRDASMWFIFGDDWNDDVCKLITFLAVWQWCNFPRFETLDFRVFMHAY